MYRMDLISTLLRYRISLLDEIERCENIKYNNCEDVSTELRSYSYSLRTELRNIDLESDIFHTNKSRENYMHCYEKYIL